MTTSTPEPVSSADVAAAARQTLETYLPGRLAAGVGGRPALQAPTRYDEVPTSEAIRRVKRSVLAVSVPNTLGVVRHGDGTYDAIWQLSIAVMHEQTPDLPLLTAAGDYNACVRAVLLAHQSLGGLASELEWTVESNDLLSDALTPSTLGMAVCEFAVHVPQVASEVPLTGPGADGPEATEATVYTEPNW